jgi:drug/metabolite transporter (DMT)-like permease
MKELVTVEQANHFITAFIIAAPIIGAVVGAFYKKIGAGALTGLLLGLTNFMLWKFYNGITEKLGLDTVKNFGVNLVLFVAVGIGAGFVWAAFIKPQQNRRHSDNGFDDDWDNGDDN